MSDLEFLCLIVGEVLVLSIVIVALFTKEKVIFQFKRRRRIAKKNEPPLVTLITIYALMQQQSRGQGGDLPTDGSFKTFRVKDVNETEYYVFLRWNRNDWAIYTNRCDGSL